MLRFYKMMEGIRMENWYPRCLMTKVATVRQDDVISTLCPIDKYGREE